MKGFAWLDDRTVQEKVGFAEPPCVKTQGIAEAFRFFPFRSRGQRVLRWLLQLRSRFRGFGFARGFYGRRWPRGAGHSAIRKEIVLAPVGSPAHEGRAPILENHRQVTVLARENGWKLVQM